MARHPSFRTEEQKRFGRLFSSLCGMHSAWEVWADFVTLSAVALSNSFDRQGPVHDEREKEYLRIIHRYGQEERETFPKLLAVVTEALERDPEQDLLGEMFSGLELNSHWKGQFFTPYHLCRFIAKATLGDVETKTDRRGWTGISDPCCGAGALLIAARNELVDRGVPSTAALFVAQDIDRTAALMCYIQLALLGCAGYVVVGNSLVDPVAGHQLTPATAPKQEVWYLPMFYHWTWQERIRWHWLEQLLTDQSCAPTLPAPTPEILAPAAAPTAKLNTTSTGQLTLF